MIDTIGKKLLKEFQKGDLVSWKKLGNKNKNYGLIKRLYLRELHLGRSFAMALITLSNGELRELNLGLLNLESKGHQRE